jgi:hypothetical protein
LTLSSYSCGWNGPSPKEDKCPGCGRENVMSAACPKCGGHYRFLTDANLSAPPSAQPAPASEQIIRDAIDILTIEADSVRECHTKGIDDWTGEPEAKAAYDRMLRTVAGLRSMTDAQGAGKGE